MSGLLPSPLKARPVVRAVVYNFFVFERKGDPRWGAAGAQKEDAEADNIVIGADRFVLKGNHHRVFSHSPA
ncbi:MAG: hypothetical protein ABSH25_15205 [Syntrophorhabdales bacterium]|jgi:hypothetical protein